MLQLSAENRINVVPPVNEWFIQRFDYNKDISTQYLDNKYRNESISWSSKGLLRIGHLAPIFQIYCKEMPEVGECLKTEGWYHASKEKVNLVNMVKDIVGGEGITHPFTTAEEMLRKQRNMDN